MACEAAKKLGRAVEKDLEIVYNSDRGFIGEKDAEDVKELRR